MYKCRHFVIEELVPPDLYHETDNPDVLWWLFDDRLLRAADQLREDFGPMVVNDWIWGGGYTESGLRLPGSKHYRPMSQHSHGRALDLKPLETPVEVIRSQIIEWRKEYMYNITGLELDVPWLHIDTRNNHSSAGPHVFRP